jgi:ribosomal protein S18 acetylase RimI-like enzyme
VEIREVRPDEWEDLKRLRLRALQADPDAFGTSFEEASANPDIEWRKWAREGWGSGPQVTLVAVDGNRWVGMGVCVIRIDDPESSDVFAMWVEPESRRRGAAGKLLDALTAWAASRGVNEVRLTVSDRNSAAVGLYESAGFEATGDAGPLRPGSSLRKLQMRKAL